MKLLIVEDNEDNRRLAGKRLRAAGWTVLEATDAPTALECLRLEGVDLVLLDLQLPGMDGLGLAATIRATPELHRLVLVACTAFAMAGDREKALAAGCDGYISKPIDIRQLPEQLLEILHETRR